MITVKRLNGPAFALNRADPTEPFRLACGEAETSLFITPGFPFRVADLLLTNFHLPASSLLVLVAAFAGYERMMSAYALAIAERYRFYSFGDAMLIERQSGH